MSENQLSRSRNPTVDDDHREALNSLIRSMGFSFKTFSSRELDVMRLVVRALLNKHVAEDLGTSEITLKIQRGHVTRKIASRIVRGAGQNAREAASI
jgi:FixJ family two-component response regulator